MFNFIEFYLPGSSIIFFFLVGLNRIHIFIIFYWGKHWSLWVIKMLLQCYYTFKIRKYEITFNRFFVVSRMLL